MPFVEHVAAGDEVVVDTAPGSLGHDQSMVGDDEVRGAGAADRVFDEAGPVMLASAVNALAATVGDGGQEAGAEQFGEPAGQVTAGDIAIGGGQSPAGDEAKGNRGVRSWRGKLFLVVEQA